MVVLKYEERLLNLYSFSHLIKRTLHGQPSIEIAYPGDEYSYGLRYNKVEERDLVFDWIVSTMSMGGGFIDISPEKVSADLDDLARRFSEEKNK